MGLLDNRVSQDDIDIVNDMDNHPQYESGFDGNDDLCGDNGMDDFGDLNDLFDDNNSELDTEINFGGASSSGDSGSNNSWSNISSTGNTGIGSSGIGGTGFGNTGFGNTGISDTGFGGVGFGNTGFGGSGFGNSSISGGLFNQNPMMQNSATEPQKDNFDKAIDLSVDVAKSIGSILIEMVKSVKERNADDFGYLSNCMIKTGAVTSVSGIILGIIGVIASIKILSFSGMSPQLILSGALSIATGCIGLGVAALVLSKMGEQETNNLDDIEDEPLNDNNVTNEYEENIGDICDEIFGLDFDIESELDRLSDDNDEANSSYEFGDRNNEEDEFNIEPEAINYQEQLSNVQENSYMSRQTLFNTFCNIFPTNTPKFADKKAIEVGSNDWKTLKTICMKALSNLLNCSLEEVNSNLESAEETLFAYELRVKRVSKVKKPEDLANEIQAYMKDENNPDVTVSASISGDFYKIIISKGESAVVTFGDIFKQDYCREFFLNEKNKLPMIIGIDELGKVILDDAKVFDTMLIAGKPRSGKSWTVNSILMCLMLFNTPEDVQFCIIDPKESNLFKTIALLPHVCGLHNDSKILQILDDIIEIEAPRRKKLLADNRCDDIWALRKKGIKAPVLYVVIDEYITVINNLDPDNKKEFDAKIQTLISQLPSLGIRLIFVPHRATGIVNKTNRTMLQFTAAVKSDIADVKDTLGIDKWDRALTKPGDMAIKTSSIRNAIYARGAALTTQDEENAEFIETAAKIFYKMGVDLPDMSNMRVATNRNEEQIRNTLCAENNRVQFDVNSLDNTDDFNIDEL